MATASTVEERLAALEAKFASQHPDEACPPEECVPLTAESDDSKALMAIQKETECPIELKPASDDPDVADNFLAVVNRSGGTKVKSGSLTNPIVLDGLQEQQGTFYGIAAFKQDGTLQHWKPLSSETVPDKQYKLVTIGNKICQVLDKCCAQFVTEDIPTVCAKDATFVLGGVTTLDSEGNTVINIVKVTQSNFYQFICQQCNIESYDDFWDIMP